MKSISCLDDPSLKPLKIALKEDQREKITESLRRLIICVSRADDYRLSEMLFIPSTFQMK